MVFLFFCQPSETTESLLVLQGGGDGSFPDLLPPVQTVPAVAQRGVCLSVLGPRRRHVGELMLLGEQDALVLVAHPHQLGDALADEVEHLADAHEDAHGAGHHHEEHEDLLLGGAADEAVDGVGTRLQGAFGQPARKQESGCVKDASAGSFIILSFASTSQSLTWEDHIRDTSGTGCRGTPRRIRP